MNKEVKFEIIKLLKEKSFDFPKKASQNDYQGEPPTIAEVVMWLYEKHGVWIYVQRDWDVGKCLGFEGIIDGNDGIINTKTFNSPTEAYEDAIKYTLENII